MNDWYLNDSFNLFRNFLVNLNNFGNDFFYFYDSINRHYFLDNNFHCKRSINSVSNWNNFFHNLRYFYNSFLSLNYHDRSFNNSVNNNVFNLYMILNLFSCDNINFFNDFLYNFLDLNDFCYSHNFLDNLFHINRDLHNFLNYFFHSYNLLLINNHLFNFSLNMINNFSNCNWSIYFNYLLNYSINSVHFRDFSDYFNDSVLHNRDLYCFLDDFLNLHYFFLASVHNNWYFDGYRDSLLDFNYFLDLDYLLNNFLYCNDLRNFHNSIYDFFYYLFNLNYLWYYSKHFKNIVNVDHIHNFLINHSNNSLINFKSDSSSFSKFFKLFQECFDQYS